MAYVNVGHTFSHLVMLLYPTAVLALERVWDIGFAELLPLGFAGYLLFGLGALPSGWLGDRWDSAKMIAAFFIGTGAACVLTGLAAGPVSIAVGLTLIGLFASIYHPVALAWIVGSGDRPGRALGVNGVYGAVGTASAALLAGALADYVHWRAAFLLPGAVSIAFGLAFLVELGRGRCAMERLDYRPKTAPMDRDGMQRGLILILIAILFTGMIFQMNAVGLPKIFQARLGDRIGFGALAAGGLVSIVYLVSTLGQLAGGHLADRFDERRLYLASYALQIGVLALAALTQNLALVALAALAVTVQTGTQPIENCLVARYTPSRWRATVFGLKFVVALGLSALGVPLIALIFKETGGFEAVFLAMAGFAATALAIALFLPSERRSARAVAASPAA
jgi:MFS family permease